MHFIYTLTMLMGMFTFSMISHTAFSMEDRSLKETNWEKIDYAMYKAIEIGTIRDGLSKKGIIPASKLIDQNKERNLCFIAVCQNSHPVFSGIPKEESDFVFFDSYENFYENYVVESIHNLVNKKKITGDNTILCNLHFDYYESAFNFFLAEENFEKSFENFNKMYICDKKMANHFIGVFVARENDKNRSIMEKNEEKPQEERSFLEKQRYFTLCKYEKLFRDIRTNIQIKEKQDETLNTLDYIMLSDLYNSYSWRISDQLKRSNKFLQMALKTPLELWPSSNSYGNRDRRKVEHALAHRYYKMDDFDSSLQCYANVSDDLLEKNDYLYIAVMLAKKQLWQESFRIFDKFYTGELDLCSHEALSLIEVLLRQKPNVSKEYKSSRFIRDINKMGIVTKNEIESLFKDIEKCKAQEKEERIKKYQKIRLKAMAYDQFESICPQYASFDIQYQNLWAHGSFLPPEEMDFLVEPLDSISQKIQKNYEEFAAFEKDINSYADNIGNIMALAHALRDDLDCFFREMIQINSKISKIRRQLHRDSLNLKKGTKDFIEFEPLTISYVENLKKQVLAEQEERQKQAKGKREITEEKQQMRKERREFLGREYEEQQQKNESKKISISETSVEEGPLSFTHIEIQNFWEAHSWEKWNFNGEKIIELLKAVDKAKSTYHLRSLLPSGVQLEFLSGDRKGRISLRINDQWRLCFHWFTGIGATFLEIVDYH